VYTSRYLEPPFKPFQGICLEPQFFPDSPNNPEFPFEFTGPDAPLNAKIIYALMKNDK
jgi:aldose 1-epimerase